MTPDHFRATIYNRQDNNNNNNNIRLLTPGDFQLYRQISKNNEKKEYIPEIVTTWDNCKNIRTITKNIAVQTKCLCSETIPYNYLSNIQSADDIYKKMSAESDLPW